MIKAVIFDLDMCIFDTGLFDRYVSSLCELLPLVGEGPH